LVEELAFFPHAVPVLAECEHVPEADQFPAHLEYGAIRKIATFGVEEILGDLGGVYDDHGFPEGGEGDEIA
jgi:hypothetical protein